MDRVVMPAPDAEELAVAATLARPFSLQSEAIYGPEVAKSLVHFSASDEQREMCMQLARMWKRLPLQRMQTFASTSQGRPLLPVSGVWDGEIADRVLYAKLVHADDAGALLEHINDAQQQWSLAGIVGDWLAVIAHQQALLRWVRPDICALLTPWAGTPTTIFERLGVSPGVGQSSQRPNGKQSSGDVV
ncbi:MAG TPA: hypothetical protein VFV66_12375 [Nonomuraea sp.]|nr:hypothetical protein [Nonomuraea sp.]